MRAHRCGKTATKKPNRHETVGQPCKIRPWKQDVEIAIFWRYNKEKRLWHLFCHRLMELVAGLEPARGCPRGILSPLRLPIPPHQRTHCVILYCMDLRAKHCSIELINANGWRWIRTTEANCSRFTVCPLWPLGNPSMSGKSALTMWNCSICSHKLQDVFIILV